MISSPLVCLVDDSPDYCFMIQHLFKQNWPTYSLSSFTDGKVFLDALSQLRPLPNLILLDRHMPHVDGHQTLLFLKGHPRYKKVPVVMMSAEASAAEIDNCYEAGVNSFLRKSFTFDSMKEQMQAVCQYWLKMNQTIA